jgi:hypothetical protein
MKKILKPFLITILSLLGLVLATVTFIVWMAFTPERLGPVVQSQAGKFLTCETRMGDVELTFFSTFPRFGLKVENIRFINPIPGAPTDTLASLEKIVGVIDLAAFWRRNEIILSEISFENGSINAFIDANGFTNFDVLISDTTVTSTPATESGSLPGFIDLAKMEFKNINLSYIDDTLKIKSGIKNLDAEISGSMNSDNVSGRLKLTNSLVSMQMDGENYLDNAVIVCDIPASVVLSKSFINLNQATISVNGLSLALNGSIEMDSLSGGIISRMDYDFKRWPITSMLAMVPVSMHHYFSGIAVDGILSSGGSVNGIYLDSIMPLMDINILLENGTLKYDSFHLPLHDMVADVHLHSDLTSNDISYVTINHFNAKTPQSTFSTKGTLRNLFDDLHCDLTTDLSMSLAEFTPLIPDSLKPDMSGRITGSVSSVFALSHFDKMLLEKMKISGNLLATNVNVKLDSIWLKTDHTKMGFRIPNNNASHPEATFAFTDIKTRTFEAGKDGEFSTFMENASLSLEMSDVRDTTRIPDVFCLFKMDTLSAQTDSIFLFLAQPDGNMLVSPVESRVKEPEIKLVYASGNLLAGMGTDSVLINRLSVNTHVVNDESQNDVFLKWLAKGFIDMEQGKITTSILSFPIEIPAIKMDFEPENLDIKESRIVIDKSDFQLYGTFRNVLSYFRGDSLLRGNFNFNSQKTDILQLMSLTNGIGNEDTTVVAENSSTNNSESSGPYMVPKGVDLELIANVQQASFGVDTATNIVGTLRIRDGVMLLDEMEFATSAARMKLTAMYRTPRKNHLFVGINYHMLDIEIEELLKIIPDIDSLMPMLRSFRGKGEFHLGVQSSLDSTYTIKKSTLMGAASITGQNLVLMDGETFGEIAKTLRFNKRTENRVDSLSAEFTIFREEIDVYPFLIVMDKYKAVVAGRHNFDLSFNYHISVVDSPLPVKFGIDIVGDMDGGLTYKPAMTRYAEFYRPASRGVVDNQYLELRRMIRETLTQRLERQPAGN